MEECFKALEALSRFEQRLALKKGKFVDVLNTPCIKRLSYDQKKRFFNYLKHKKVKVRLLVILAFISLAGILAFSPQITGNVIIEDPTLNYGVVIIFTLIFIGIIGISFLLRGFEGHLNKRLKSHLALAESSIAAYGSKD
jgi:hypothetical protein